MSKILITGAAGFIGSHLVETLLEQKVPLEKLRLLIPKGESLTNLPNLHFDIVRGRVENEKDVRKAMKDISVVYHLAALTIDGGKYFTKAAYTRVNVVGTENLLKACRWKNIKKFVFFSSIAVYGLPAWAGNIRNWNEDRPKNPMEIYGESKLLAEDKVRLAHKKWKIPYAIIRPTSVYGPRDKRNLLELYKAISKHLFFYIGNGRNKMDYVYVKDVALAAILATKSDQLQGDYIIGCGKALRLREIASLTAKSIHVSILPFYMPMAVAFLLSIIVEKLSKAMGIKPMLFPDRVKVMTRDCFYDISKARKELGYKPVYSFEKGTQLTAMWLKNNNVI